LGSCSDSPLGTKTSQLNISHSHCRQPAHAPSWWSQLSCSTPHFRQQPLRRQTSPAELLDSSLSAAFFLASLVLSNRLGCSTPYCWQHALSRQLSLVNPARLLDSSLSTAFFLAKSGEAVVLTDALLSAISSEQPLVPFYRPGTQTKAAKLLDCLLSATSKTPYPCRSDMCSAQ